MCAKELQKCSVLWLLCPWDSPGKNTGVGCHFLLQGIFPPPGPNLGSFCLLHWQVGSLPLAPPGKSQVLGTQVCLTLCDPRDCGQPGSSVHEISQTRILEWVAFPFSRGSSWPKDWTWVSSIVGRFFTIWATRESSQELDRLTFFPSDKLNTQFELLRSEHLMGGHVGSSPSTPIQRSKLIDRWVC